MIREAKSCNIPLEMNLLGVREDRHYPNSDFWEIVAEENCPVIIGADAHTPEVFASTLAEEKALAWLKKLGLTPMQTIPLRKIT
jgi:histidinol-phosphatase (PHP family)